MNEERDAVRSALSPYFGDFVEAGSLALRRLGGESSDRSQKLQRQILTEYFLRELVGAITGAILVPSGGGEDWVLIPEVALVRVKSTDSSLQVRNIRTRRLRRLLSNEGLPGIPPDLPRVEICYVANSETTDFRRLVLTQRTADAVLLAIDLPWAGVPASAVESLDLGLPETTVKPKDDALRVRRGVKEA